jgi:hypothetical protein
MKIISIVFLSIVICGCASMRQRALYAPCNQITNFVDKANCLNQAARSDNNISRVYGAQELVAYSSVLSEKVKSNQMTNSEATYEFEQKKNYLIQQEAETSALNRANKPHFTNTHCTVYGTSVHCDSY